MCDILQACAVFYEKLTLNRFAVAKVIFTVFRIIDNADIQ